MTNLAPKLVTLDQTFSIPSLNQRWITRMSGSEIAAHNIAGEPLNILCIEDGAGFLNGHFYVIGEDGIIRDVFGEHDHTSSAAGGTYYSIKRANYKNDIEFDQSLNISAEPYDFTEIPLAGAGTFVNAVDGTAHTKYAIATTAGSAAANNDVCNMSAGGGRLWFGAPLTLQVKYAVSDNTSIAFRIGCGQPKMENAFGITAMLGFEGCTGTNQFVRAFSADGSAWSAGEDMDNMVPTGSIPLGLRIDFYPTSKIVATSGLGTVKFKTDNLPPPSTATQADATFRFGVKQIAASSARWIKLYAARVVGSSYDSQPGISAWC